MKKLKDYWGKLKYWQKGGIIGLLIGVLLNLYLFIIGGIYDTEIISIGNFHLGDWLFHLVPLVLYAFMFDSVINSSINLVNLTMVILWYTFLGILVGLIYKYIKQEYPKRFKTIFIIVFIIFIIMILAINFLILILLLAKAG